MIISKAIITALPQEAELIVQKFSLKQEKIFGSLTIYNGMRDNEGEKENIILILCGEGKIQSSMATTYLCENYDVEKIVNIGIAGNLNDSLLSIGDVILPNTFVQHDFYMPESIDFLQTLREPIFLEYAIGDDYNLEKFTLHLSGICATGDQFVDNTDLKSEIAETYGADVVDMEAYGILAVLRNYDMLDKAVVIKAISDKADESGQEDSMKNLESAMQNSLAILEFTL